MDECLEHLKAANTRAPREEVEEALAFLSWLRDDHFAFIGCRSYEFDVDEEGKLRSREPAIARDSGRGILRDPERTILRRTSEPLVIVPAIEAFLRAPSPVIVAKANMKSRVHRRVYMDDAEGGFPILGLVTTGDQITDRALLEAGGKGLFTRELDRAQLDGQAAFAVHSMKDVPTHLPDGLELACVLEREDPSDILLTASGPGTLESLPQGALIGTASLRRQAQALYARPDLQITLLRGNVGTRLQKLKDGPITATFLAKAGLKRLGRPEGGWPGLSFEHCLPAPAQGAIGITIRSDDEAARAALAPLNHDPARGKLRAAGKPNAGIEIRVVGEDGEPVAQGEVGEVWIRGTSLMTGYWNRPDATAEAINADGWFKSGDAGYLDKDGYLFIHER